MALLMFPWVTWALRFGTSNTSRTSGPTAGLTAAARDLQAARGEEG